MISLVSQLTNNVNLGVGAIAIFFVLGIIVFKLATDEEKNASVTERMIDYAKQSGI